MTGKGKLVSQVSIKYSKGDAFQLFKVPNYIADISPVVQSVDLHAGQWGTVGSVIFWNFTIDGKKMVAKEMVEAVDEEKKSITLKLIEGDLQELYSAFKMSISVNNSIGHEEDNYLVTWTLEYEKRSEAVPDPHTFMDSALAITPSVPQR